jgi:3-hydroxyisobutyrate dehydrogenase
MGAAMASRIVAAGWSTVLWARRPAAIEPLLAPNVAVADTPAALAAAVDLVGVCVWADDDVRAVLDGPDGVLAGCRPGTVVAIHSTVHPRTCQEIAERSAPLGVVVVDAPVSGGPPAAEAGALTLALGGDAVVIEACRPVFEAFASSLVHLGDIGAGQLAKLLNNAVFAANLAVADDAVTLGTELGLDADALARFLGEGSGRSFALDLAARVRTSAVTRDGARRALEKDVERLADASASIPGADVLRAAAACAVDRLSNPPSAWTELKE